MQQYLSTKELARLLGRPPRTLIYWRKHRKGPPFIRAGHRTIFYNLQDVDAWLAAHKGGTA